MPRKINKRKAIQTAKRKAAADIEARKRRPWVSTRRVPIGVPLTIGVAIAAWGKMR